MAQVSEHLEGCYGAQGALIGKVREWNSERLVLECDCRSRLVLVGRATMSRSERDHLECGVCGEKFVRVRMVDRRSHAKAERRGTSGSEQERRYSWLEAWLERLEGKEARQDYYARLEDGTGRMGNRERRTHVIAPADTSTLAESAVFARPR